MRAESFWETGRWICTHQKFEQGVEATAGVTVSQFLGIPNLNGWIVSNLNETEVETRQGLAAVPQWSMTRLHYQPLQLTILPLFL